MLNFIFSLFVMLDFRCLSAVDATRVCELGLSGLWFTAPVGWLSSMIELNCYQLFIIHPITSISTTVCDLPRTGGLFIRFSSMESYILVECLSIAKAFLQCDKWYKLLCSQCQDVITSSQKIWDRRNEWPLFGHFDIMVVYCVCQYVNN